MTWCPWHEQDNGSENRICDECGKREAEKEHGEPVQRAQPNQTCD